jgi:hypothetical protein
VLGRGSNLGNTAREEEGRGRESEGFVGTLLRDYIF